MEAINDPKPPCGDITHDGGYWVSALDEIWYCPDCGEELFLGDKEVLGDDS